MFDGIGFGIKKVKYFSMKKILCNFNYGMKNLRSSSALKNTLAYYRRMFVDNFVDKKVKYFGTKKSF